MKNIEIGKDILRLLLEDEELTKIVDNKVFPIIGNASTTFPFIIYQRSGYQPNDNKDYQGEKVTVDFVCCSTRYEESLQIVNLVLKRLIHVETEIIEDAMATNMYENYLQDTYCQFLTITFTLKTEYTHE